MIYVYVLLFILITFNFFGHNKLFPVCVYLRNFEGVALNFTILVSLTEPPGA